MSNFKKAIFLYFCLFNIEQMTLRNCWIRSQVFWCQKWSFCHNYYLRYLQQFDQFKLGLPNCTSQYCYLNGLFNIVYSNDMFLIKLRRWLYSNRGPLESEATTLPTEPQPLPIYSIVWPWIWNNKIPFYGGRNGSVVSCPPTTFESRVWIPCSKSMLFSIFIVEIVTWMLKRRK